MAFGAQGKAMAANSKPVKEDGEQQIFVSQWMPTGSGSRLFYLLPEVKDGVVSTKPRMSANDKPVKKDGKPVIDMVTAEETVFCSAWWPVMVNGELRQRRIMIDPKQRYDNPLAKLIDQKWPRNPDKNAQQPRERSTIKLQFAMNVYDVSPVKHNDKDQPFYMSESGNFDLLAFMNNGKVITDPEQLPKGYDNKDGSQPLNAIRILEGSYGKPGGKHLFQDFYDLDGTIENSDGDIVQPTGVQLRLRCTGTGMATSRSIRATANFKLPDSSVYQLPRYKLAEWTMPWSNTVIQRLLDGDDFNEIVEEYGLVLFPTLEGSEADADFE